jgi:hypothetical protein
MKCSFIKDSDEQCKANAMNGSEFCYLHNPDISDEEKREAQTKGGANRALTLSEPLPVIQLSVPNDAIILITDTISRVRAGELDIKTANCIGFLTDKLLKAFEVAKLNDKAEFIEQVILEKRTRY